MARIRDASRSGSRPERRKRAGRPRCRRQGWLGEPGWLKRFIEARRPGAYLRVIGEGSIRADDHIEVVVRPQHNVTVALAFRAFTTEPDLLPRLALAEALPDEAKALLRNRNRNRNRSR